MAKAAILDVLENTIGKYVQNLDAGKLSILLFFCALIDFKVLCIVFSEL